MKRVHLAIFIAAVLLMLFSGYSMAALNMVYKVPFEWYSPLQNLFVSEPRNTSFYSLSIPMESIKPRFEAILDHEAKGTGIKRIRSLMALDFEQYLYVYCTLGEVTQIDSNIKFREMAQRGATLEIITAVNVTANRPGKNLYYPEDIVRIEKKKLINKGKMLFVFKNQYGAKIDETVVNMIQP